jgi:hypothetical protein
LESRLVLMGLTGPPPTLSSVTPNAVPEGTAGAVITVTGSNFVPSAVVDFNGIDLPTTFVNSSQLTATIPGSLLKEETMPEHGFLNGFANITVVEFNVVSNPLPFTITEAPIVAQGGFSFTGPLVLNATLATFTDTGGPEFFFDYQAVVDWGDGSSDSGAISGPDASGVFTVTDTHVYPNNNPFIIKVTITHETAPPVTVMDFVNGGGPVNATGGFQVNGVEGQPINNVKVATFTNPSNPGEPASNFSATVAWGDGTTSTGAIFGPDAGGVYTVTGSHTYVEEGQPEHGGPFTITVTILHMGISSVQVTDPTNIVEAPLSATGGFSFTGPTLSNVTLATFSDTGGAEPLVDYAASVNWGDGTTTAGTISLPSGSSVFTVSGSHTYSTLSSFTITVTITHETAPPVTVTDRVSTPVTVTATGGFTVFGVEGMPNTNVTVATFTSSNPNARASDFTATIKWGDGPFQNVNDVTTGTISGPGPGGVFTVTGSYTYIEESDDVGQLADTLSATPFYTITVTITPATGAAATALSQGRIFDAPLNVTGGFNITGTAGSSLSATVATFIDTGHPIEIGTNIYVATVDWGDGSSPDQATISGPNGGGVFTVTDGHTYASAGVFTITVTIAHEFATTVSVTDTATINAPVRPPGADNGGPKQASPAATVDQPPAIDQLFGMHLTQQGQLVDSGASQSDSQAQRAALLARSSATSPSAETDLYWQLDQRQNRVMDSNDGAAYDLALALESNLPGSTQWWTAPS